ncbi:DNA-binding MarR family transcriptional regulator [Rhizobium leguminosarum]|uniref:DNA-binding MarR family transcriptional regulator n=1 Tax=Rhizobium leguminosarum TaxID=384 RepID=A0AAE2MFP3_RHILE|nr:MULTISPECIES: MarR family transcriptional regulator [Rhizobium]MBB4288362.1 DNA-binding MarR family transcriptional regulator [Rhizobium leguminosarum]MBB4295545.1 DNA-binding MarR family transcriptional regulator [Rhizobium leguminosarum]MBB4306939.1 DNA-binding MarR family transcriptional regulator [Rhizobium leguminosarum]MBB4417479.1 DNA-binding MarR family transcriptional regulator [Rhizobium leguminosarum]MBB4432323.1 DNA-binding MarR family transcriptional regulator [Rhizobium espera
MEGNAFSAFAITALRLAGHLTAAGDQLARPAGQTSARWQVLAAARRGDMSVAQIARALGLARQGVQRLTDVLEGEGLIAYADNPQHQRAKLVRLTAEGATRLDVIEVAQAGWADGLGAAFTAAELDAARAVMARVMAMLEGDGAAGG